MHYFKFNLKDYAFATMYFDYVHHGAYLKLISLYYETEKPLPLDVDFVLKRVMANKQEEIDAVKHILDNFFTKTEVGYVQKRCDDLIAKYQAQCSINREVGKLGGRPKAKENRNGSEKKPKGNPNHKPLTINKEPVYTSNRFDEFWSAWPSSKRKIAKAECLKKWQKGNLDEKADQIIKHVNAMKESSQWKDGYDPAPMTYLNQARYEDDLPEDDWAPRFR